MYGSEDFSDEEEIVDSINPSLKSKKVRLPNARFVAGAKRLNPEQYKRKKDVKLIK